MDSFSTDATPELYHADNMTSPALEVKPAAALSITSRPRLVALSQYAPSRILALDGIRGVAILLVLCWHVVFQLKPSSHLLSAFLRVGALSWSGVDLFFVLSGFLIGGILLDEKDSPRYFKTFYLRRALRILPIYLVLFSLFLMRFRQVDGLPTWLSGFSDSSVPWLSYLSFTQNFWMAGVGSFGAGTMAATWSLAVEEQFYITAPLLVRRVRRRTLCSILIAVMLSAPILRVLLHQYLPKGNFADYVLMPCRADALTAGVLAALLIRAPKAINWLRQESKLLNGATITLGTVLGLLMLTAPDATSTLMVTAGYSALALFYAGILLVTVISDGPVTCFFESVHLRRLGRLAYFVYLFHLPAIESARRLTIKLLSHSTTFAQFAGGVLGVALTIFVAKLSWTYFEGPLVRFGHRFSY